MKTLAAFLPAFLVFVSVQSQDSIGTVVNLTEKIGPVIDPGERDRYGMFMSVPDFDKAALLRKPDGSFVFRIVLKNSHDPQDSLRWFPCTEKEVQEIRRRIETGTAVPPVTEGVGISGNDVRTSGGMQSGVEFLSGLAGGAVLGAAGLGMGMIGDVSDATIEPFIGLAVGMALGSMIGVGWAGEALHDSGGMGGAFWGAMACPAIGAFAGVCLVSESSGDGSPWEAVAVCTALGSLLSPLGATLGYAASRPHRNPGSGAWLEIENGHARAGFPRLSVQPVLSPMKETTPEVRMKMISIRI